jgi:predicted MPP superfamily phosphohydrolase
MIEQANNPDLIVLTGDTFEKETTEQVDVFYHFHRFL